MNWFAQFEQTHMPYMVHLPNELYTFFCVKNQAGAWKLHCASEYGCHLVENDLPDDWNECCPVAEWEDDALRLSFVAGPTREPGKYGLYRMTHRLMILGSAETTRLLDADVGFAREDWLVYGSRRGPLIVRRGKNEQELHIAGLDFLYRVCPDAFAPSRLLITASVNGLDESIIYDFHSGECQKVTENHCCLYKFAAHGLGGFLYAVRGNGDNEDRKVVQSGSGSVMIVPAPGLIQLKPREKEDSMDCVACFRKHIAAALSFAKEIMAGHGDGADLDHRADLEGEIANAEQHAREMTVPGYAMALRELRHNLDAKSWHPAPDDIVVLRKLWKSSMGVSCGCSKHRREAIG